MAEKGISQKLGDRPTLKDLNKHVRSELCGACETNPEAWKDLGRELMPDSDAALSTIAVNANKNVTTCCSSLFKLWLDRQPEASWGQLIEALKEIIGLENLATKIERKLQPSVASASSHTTTTTASQMTKAASSGSPLLAQKVGMHELTKIVIPRVKAEWKDLAYAMRYEIGEVDAFYKDGRDLHERCVNLFTNWMKTNHFPTPQTYQTLLKYIRKVDNLTAASEEIEEKLVQALSDE